MWKTNDLCKTSSTKAVPEASEQLHDGCTNTLPDDVLKEVDHVTLVN